MKKLINEQFRRMQLLVGLITESQLDEGYYDEIEGYTSTAQNKSGYKVISNTTKYQKNSKHINTCGRWCCVRLKFRYLNEEQFKKLWKNIPNDEEITELTILYSL